MTRIQAGWPVNELDLACSGAEWVTGLILFDYATSSSYYMEGKIEGNQQHHKEGDEVEEGCLDHMNNLTCRIDKGDVREVDGPSG